MSSLSTEEDHLYPEVYKEYVKEQMDRLVLYATYLNPLDSKLLNGLMTVIVLITAAICIAKLCKLHLSRHPTIHQYIIFYGATVECLLCGVHWILGQYVELDFIVQYLKLVQFLVVSHLYWTLATRIVRKDKLTAKVLLPVYSLALIYLTVVVVFGCVNIKNSWVECLEPYWLMLSSVELALVQLFMLAGVYITRRLNEISTLDCVRRAQKRDLWILVSAFELSAIVGFAYDLTLRALGDEEIGCSGIFVIKLLLPMWAMLFVFHPVEYPSDQDELLQQHYSSVFSQHYDQHHYRPLSHPSDILHTSEADFTPSPSTDLSTPVFGPLRSNLATIREENNDHELIMDTSDRAPIIKSLQN